MLLTFHADESYNNRTFNFGGWLGTEPVWKQIERQWLRRLEYERKKHGKLERYHASHCASFHGDYEGWSLSDQILHTKKLQAILTRSEVAAITSGLDLKALNNIFPANKNRPLEGAYNLSVRRLMIMITQRVKRGKGHKVAIIHDRTTGYDSVILDAFNSMLNSPMPHFRELFTTIAPMSWEDCIPLQAADMIAFDTFKLLDGEIHSTAHMRRSLEAMLGQGVKLSARYLGENSLRHLHQMAKEKKESVHTSGI